MPAYRPARFIRQQLQQRQILMKIRRRNSFSLLVPETAETRWLAFGYVSASERSRENLRASIKEPSWNSTRTTYS